jgi:predicted nucleotidyltransferase
MAFPATSALASPGRSVGDSRHMSTSEQISEICDAIAREFNPEKIIVFGSHAYGTPGPYSDLDLLIVMTYEGSPLQQAARIITRVNPKIGVDVIVRSAEQIMREIVERGRVAYEADRA